MGLFQMLFGHKEKENEKVKDELTPYFETLSGYSPVYTSQDGGIYELGICRSAIHRKALESSKANPALTIPNKRIEYIVKKRPNPYMTASQFYYRLRTIYEVENNAFIVPIEDDMGKIIGVYPIVPSMSEIKEYNKKLYVIYTFGSGEKKAIELERVGHVKKMQYKDDFFGSSNRPFRSIADLIRAQEKGTKSAIENGSDLRFMGKLNTEIIDEEDFKEQQEFLQKMNLRANNTGVFLWDNRYEDMKQLLNKPVLLDSKQKETIDNSAYTYWNISENILQNKYNEDEWNAFYESEIETFFIQTSEVLTFMLYTESQIKNGNEILLASDRLQYASNTTKINVAKEYYDRGLITKNQALKILNMPPVEGGDTYKIRAEYINEADVGKGGKEKDELNGQNSSTNDAGAATSGDTEPKD